MTTTKPTPPGRVKLRAVRLAFAQSLWEASAYKEGPPKFSCTLLVPKGDKAQIAAVEAAMLAVATGRWGAKAAKTLAAIRPNAMRCAWQDGETKDYEGYEGNMALRAGNKIRVPVFDAEGQPTVQSDGVVYSGCYVNAIVTFYSYDNSGAGIGCSLDGVRFVKDGEAFSGGTVASAEDFDDMTDVADLTS